MGGGGGVGAFKDQLRKKNTVVFKTGFFLSLP